MGDLCHHFRQLVIKEILLPGLVVDGFGGDFVEKNRLDIAGDRVNGKPVQEGLLSLPD
jgi:hypothetical protein